MQPKPKTAPTEAPEKETKPLTPAEELEVEIFSTDLEVELVRLKLEKQQDLAEKKIQLLMRRRRTLVRALTNERENGAGWPNAVGQKYDPVTGELRAF